MRFLHWLLHEIRALFFATVFFGIFFLAILFLKGLMLEEYDITFTGYASALLLALVTAKVVVVLGKVSFGRQIGIIEVLLRTVVYSFAAFVLMVAEHVLATRAEAGGLGPALRGAFQHADAPHIWATLICVSLAFAAYTAFTVLCREVGADRVAAAYLSPPAKTPAGLPDH